MHRLFTISALPLLMLLSACGMAEDEREEDKKQHYITIADPAFESYLLSAYDLNADSRISQYEAERVLSIDCPNRDIESLYGIGAFTSLRWLDCSGNKLTSLDLQGLYALETADCSHNELSLLQVGEIRGLKRLRCSDNRIDFLHLEYTSSLAELDCSRNRLTTLDVSYCSRTMISVDATNNLSMTIFYKHFNQQIDRLQLDGGVQIETRQ